MLQLYNTTRPCFCIWVSECYACSSLLSVADPKSSIHRGSPSENSGQQISTLIIMPVPADWSPRVPANKGLVASARINAYAKDIGYAKLNNIIGGMFINAYAPTSLREYFATGFAEFYLHPNDHTNLKRACPVLYEKIRLLHNLDKSD